MAIPFISIVLPCFNAEKFLQEALDSCTNQTFQNFEMICVDDGSTDETAVILKKYASQYPEKIKILTISNQGVSHARNLGTQQAGTEWIQYLDADDLLCPLSLEKKVEAVLKTPKADVIYTGWQKLVLKNGSFVKGVCRQGPIEVDHPDKMIAIFKGFWAPTAAYLYRKSMIEKIGGWNVSLPVIQDARFALDFAMHNAEFVHIPEVLCLFRTGHENTLSSRKQAFAKDCLRNADDIRQIWGKNGKIPAVWLDALIEVYLYVARSSREIDQDIFREAVRRLKILDKNFIRLAPLLLRLTARLVGYERAETIARKWRQIKNIFLKTK